MIESVVLVLCMAGAALFAGIETGEISIHRMRLRHFVRHGSYSARILQGFLHRPDRFLGTTLVGTNICVVVASILGASLAVRWIGEWGENHTAAAEFCSATLEVPDDDGSRAITLNSLPDGDALSSESYVNHVVGSAEWQGVLLDGTGVP